MKTRVTELLGVEKPIIQGGMAWVAESHLAAAVSNAGGFGIIGAANAPAEVVRNYIHGKQERLTDKPFGVNIMLMSPYAADIAQVVVEEKVAAVTTGAGSPEQYMEQWKAARYQGHPGCRFRSSRKTYGALRCRCGGCRGYRVRRTYRTGNDHDAGSAGG